MKQLTIALVAVAFVTVGCANKKTQDAGELSAGGPVLDVTPPPTPVASTPPAPVYDPVTVTPQPTVSPTPAPVVSSTPGSSSGRTTYSIKRGDTLYSIARMHYGDGKLYTKIIDANPGLDPQRLMVGQTIVIP